MSSTSPYAALFEHLTLGGLVVLPNARAARTLRSSFDQHQRDLAVSNLAPSAWEPARALSWQQFTTGLFNDLVLSGLEPRLLLNEAQEHHLWRDTIAASQPNALSSTDSLAELARSAWHLAAAYNAIPRLTSSATTQDTRTFALWAGDFIVRCAKSQLLSLAQLDSCLLTHLQRGSLPAPANLHIAAFDDPTPSQIKLIEALRTCGTQIIHHAIEHPAIPFRASIIAPTERDEFILGANWIRSFLKQHREQTKSVAVLVPSLDDDRAQLELTFREVLAPELESIHADLSSAPWEFATGIPLALLPILQCILDLAHWANSSLSLDRISALMLSPFLGLTADRNLAAQFDAVVLRRSTLLRPELSLPAFIALADAKSHIVPIPTWLRNFHRFVTNTRGLDKPRSFADWAEFVRALTSSANWPGERTLTASEFEATRTWDSVLDLLSTLDSTNRNVSFTAFLESLDRQTRVTNFSGPTTHAPVQIMSIEDAAGSAFDAVLFLRSTDANWPRSPQPNPLLSWQLQQDLNMPGASSTAATTRARSFTTHLLTRSGDTLFLSAAENADGKLRPAPLLEEHVQSWPAIYPQTDSSASAQVATTEFIDSVPLPPLPSTDIDGGARILQLQAACGFRAFAEFRLRAKELEEFTIGLDAPDSGQLIHRALREFWTAVKTQSRLRSLSIEDREHHLRRSIDAAISRHIQLHNTWDEAFVALQRQRLFTLLDRWLVCELERSPFEVLEHEHEDRIDVGPLILKVRFDRIDRLDASSGADDTFVLVDYKTGAAGHPNQWESERPDDPQLPLYALAYQPQELKALTFAKVTTEKMKWLGYQAAPGILPSLRANQNPQVDLPGLIAEWRSVLTQLAHDFAEGHAFVAPKAYPKTCAHCPQRLFCRLDPASLRGITDNESTEDSDG